MKGFSRFFLAASCSINYPAVQNLHRNRISAPLPHPFYPDGPHFGGFTRIRCKEAADDGIGDG
jgi:hypothetical protein